ncbi:hypothetical protein CMQ_362 [Grosmannia clavigera kw1407]|uniref:Uncharacterized protein n=1 Tax=Grosmannia clavigera (strain kw1407 / UAMH 11150) TaxID=655863 RepID=F0XCN1_GROCL|nr:uncharacterized protein CMQ_362 [Grosmannia clavigera kw1407]EFX03434.1 hypothetical protein CMQ_362 [Grosmannia clavigera kw1407]
MNEAFLAPPLISLSTKYELLAKTPPIAATATKATKATKATNATNATLQSLHVTLLCPAKPHTHSQSAAVTASRWPDYYRNYKGGTVLRS